MTVKRIALLGVGVIGGSVAKAAKQEDGERYIVGYDLSESNLNEAISAGVIDAKADSLVSAVAGADLVILATPVGSFKAIFLELSKHEWPADTLFTDVGSTKCDVVRALQSCLGFVPENFVPAHPIAGSEQSGVGAATPDLFRGRRVILTPTVSTSKAALARVSAFWSSLGAVISQMEPDHHDEVLAATSHLPHLLAFALVDLLGKKETQNEILMYAAGGFKDFTRIASSDKKMWLDICLANQDKITPLIDEYIQELVDLKGYINQGNNQALLSCFEHANQTRARFLELFNPANSAGR